MNILIVKIGAIGDVVMCLPVVSLIKKQNPNARITWICGKIVSPFLNRFPEIDQLIEIDESRLLKGSFFEKIKEITKTWKKLAGLRFDQTLYFYYSNLYKILIVPAGKGIIKRFNKNPSQRIRPVPARHHTFEYLSVFEEEKAPNQIQFVYPSITFREEDFFHFKHLKKKDNLIAFSCGGAKNFLRNDDLRRWPINHYVSLAQHLIQNGFEIVLTGAKSDDWVTESFNEVPHHNFIGKLNLPEFVGLLSLCKLMVTHDSGPLHLADIAQIPSLGLFGPTNPGDFRSLHQNSEFIWGGENLACRPCYDGRTYARCEDNLCMKSIDIELVKQKIQGMTKTNSYR